jgi:histidyl-tRNA synthetase
LAELFTKEQLPGIGASLGLDRLLTALQMLGRLPAAQTTAPILVAQFHEGDRAAYFQIAGQLRRRGLNVEVFPEPKKLGAQFKYAAKKGFAVVLVAGPDELAEHQIQVKWLADGSQTLLPLSGDAGILADWLHERISTVSVI